MAKLLRRLLCAVAMVIMIVALCTVCFAESAQEIVCYEHGDVDSDNHITNTDAIYIMYNYMYGNEEYPIAQNWDFDGDGKTDNKDAIYVMSHYMFDDEDDDVEDIFKFKGTIHSYYAPTWVWDETANTAEVTIRCGCGNVIATYTTGNGVSVTVDSVPATCVTAGSETYVATVVYDGQTYRNTYVKVLPAGTGHIMDGTADCENGASCTLCDYEQPAMGHKWELESDVQATCTVDAHQIYKCAHCKQTDTVTHPGTAAHSMRYDKDVQDGCKFTKWYACDRCDYTEAGTSASDTYYNHTYTATLTKEANCVAEGEKTYTCTCGDSYTEAIPANGSHTWGEGVPVDEVTTTYTCSNTGCEKTKTTVSAANNAQLSHESLSKELQFENGASMALDQNTLSGLDETKDVVVSITPLEENDPLLDRLSDEQKAQIGDNTVYNFNMSYSDGTAISENGTQFDGKVTVSLPYVLGQGEDIDSIDVWYIDDNGDATRVTGTYSNGFVTFATTHFSYYTVTRLTPEERCERYGHIMVESYKAATCTADGFDLAICQRCGHEEKNLVLKSSGHDYEETVVTKATCEEDGVFQKVCKVCQKTVNGKIPATGHNMQKDASQTVEPSCNNAGKEVDVCANGCGHTREYVRSQLSHNYVQHEVKAADCTTGGYIKNICTLCGDVITVKEEAPTGHNYTVSGWQWGKNNATAVVTLVCSHNSEHTKELSGVITVKTNAEATCTGAGSATYTAEAAFNKSAFKDTRVESVPATGHKVDSQWLSNASQHYHLCTVCGVEIDAAEHVWDAGVVTDEPTCEETGKRVYKCEICQAEDVETLPENEHTYENGVCTGCGKEDGACDHSQITETELDVSAYNLCEGTKFVFKSCGCGKESWYYVETTCETGEPTREEILKDGQTAVVYTTVCPDCGLTDRTVQYTRMDKDVCHGEYVMERTLTKNGQQILSYEMIMHEEDHPTTSTQIVDLTKLGLCGVILNVDTCPCGEYVYTWEDEWCDWELISEQDGVEIYQCASCQATMQSQIVRKDLGDCKLQWIETVTYFADGEQVYTYTNYNDDIDHEYKYTYELIGDSCTDGVRVTMTCTKCGDSDSYTTYYHETVYSEQIPLAEFGMCGTGVLNRGGCACGENSYCHFSYEVYDGCEFMPSFDPVTGIFIEKCPHCGTTIHRERTASSVEGEPCAEAYISWNRYVGKDGNELFVSVTRGISYSHSNIYALQLNEGATDCSQGYTVTQYCQVCGETGSWESSSTDHSTYLIRQEVLADNKLCGTMVLYHNSCACGQKTGTHLGWIDGECQWNEIWDDEAGWVATCATCGAVRTQESYNEEIEGATCRFHYVTEYTFWDKHGNKLFACSTYSTETSHEYLFSLQLKEGTSDCEGGYYVTAHCQACGYTDNWENYGHETYTTKREILSQGQLCSTVSRITYSCACGLYSGTRIDWGDNGCRWNEIWDEESDQWAYTCSVCGATRDTVYSEELAEGETCLLNRVWEYIFFDKDGNRLFSYEETGTRYEHSYIYTGVLAEGAADCDEGWIATGTCEHCDATTTQRGTGHNQWVVEKEILTENGMCGTVARVHTVCACGKNENWNISWEDCDCSWQDRITEELGYHEFCPTCGAYRTWKNFEEKVEGTTCEYLNTSRYTYFDKDGNELFSYDSHYTTSHHEYIYELQLHEGAADCDGGYTVNACCRLCGHTRSGENTGHERYTVSWEILSQGQMCGNLIMTTSRCACGKERGTSTYWENGQCSWEQIWHEARNEWVYACSACGTTRICESEEHRVEGTTCQYAVRDVYTFYDRNGNTLCSYENNYGMHRHCYEYTFRMNGTTCQDGYDAFGTCVDCGETTESIDNYHCSSFVTEYRRVVNSDDACGWVILRHYQCPCGENDSWQTNSDCVWVWDEERVVATCKNCGMQKREEHTSVSQPMSCLTTTTTRYEYILGEQSYVTEYTHTYNEHDWVYAFELLGETCADGYRITEKCIYCDYAYTYTEPQHSSHETYYIEKYNLKDYGLCGGYIRVETCACGCNGYATFNAYCNYKETGETDPETGLHEYYCEDCDTYIYWKNSLERNAQTCTAHGQLQLKLVRGGEVLLELSKEYQYIDHDNELISIELAEGAIDCTEGIIQTYRCRDCGEVHTERASYHSTMLKSAVDLAQHGACGGTVKTYGCACGEEDYSYIELGNSHRWTEQVWETTDDNGIVHDHTSRVCKDCGMTYLYEYYQVKVPGQTCEFECYSFATVTVGEYVASSQSQGWTYEHTYGEPSYSLRNEAKGCDGGVMETKTCIYCDATDEWIIWYHYGVKAESIDLSQYGTICGTTLDHYVCLCGAEEYYELGGVPCCDIVEQEIPHWIEGVIDEYQESTHGNGSYSYSYLLKCAVTDPNACGLTIRKSEYWLKNGCTVTQYVTWQLGYDEATGTCAKEITYATGRSHSYHYYERISVYEDLESGHISGYKHICNECGSFYSWINTYDADENRIQRVEETVNTLDNGENKRRYELEQYQYVNGNELLVLTRYETTDADGNVEWYNYAYEYDIANCARNCTATSSENEGSVDKQIYHAEREFHYSETNSTCTQFGEYREWYTCVYCQEIVNQYNHVYQPTGHEWTWNEELQVYVCSDCGLKNTNGATGSIVMEDLTVEKGNGASYVIGYWNIEDIDFEVNVSVILDGITGDDNRIDLDITEFTNHTVEDDGFTGLSIDKAATDTAAAEAVAAIEGYAGTYTICVTFVPVSGTDTLDYAITFDSVTAQ